MSHYLFLTMSAATFLSAVLYAHRTGQLAPRMPRHEVIARCGVTLSLAGVFLGAFYRAQNGDPFLWFHWLVLIAAVVTDAGYTALFAIQRRNQRALVAFVNGLGDPACQHAECIAARAELRRLANL